MERRRRRGVLGLVERSRTPARLGATVLVVLLLANYSPGATAPAATSVRSIASHLGPTDLTAQAQALLPSAGAPAHPHPAAGPAPRWTNLQSKLGNQVPAYRYLATMVYDPLDQYVVLFGGLGNGSTTPYSDTWTYADGHWNNLGVSGPGGRYAAMAAWDARDGYMVLFGGYDSSTGVWYNDTWTFVHGTWNSLSPTVSPGARWRGAMAFDASDNYVLLFGGTPNGGTTAPMKDTWSFAGGAWTNLTSSPGVTGNPAGRFRQDMAYDAADGYIVMFGGCTLTACPSQDTLTYHNLTWSLLSLTTKPSARAYMGLEFDSAQGYVLLFAGDDYATQTGKSDTWDFLNGSWTDLSSGLTTSPSTRAFEMMTYDGFDGYSLMFGGQNPSTFVYLNDTWAFGPSVIGHFVISPSTIDLGQSASLNATPLAASGTVNYTYSGLPPGCADSNTAALSCTPTATGAFGISVSMNDSTGVPTTKNGTLVVNPDPAITSLTGAPAVVTVGTPFWLNATAVNGTLPYGYSYSGLPGGCASANTASLRCAPTGSGTFVVTLTLSDGVGKSVARSVTVTVNPSPALPALVALPSTLDLGETLTLWANATGGTAPLSYSYANLPPGCSSVNAPTLSCTPSVTGPFAIQANVTDAFGWAVHASTTIQVNPAPQVTGFAVSPAAIDIGQPVTFWLNGTAGTGALTLGYLGMPAGCNLGRAATGTCSPTETGTFQITGTVTDTRGIVAQASVTLTVVPDPSVDAVTIVPASIDPGQNITITVVVSGGTAPISYTYTGLPTGCTNTTTAVVSCRPRTPGSYTIVATATDAWHQASQLPATLTVNAALSVVSFGATVSPVTVGSATLLQVAVAGGSGSYHYSYTGLPAGCTSANKSALSCTPSTTGTFNVTVTVTDTLGTSTTASATFDVQSAPSTASFLGLPGVVGYALLGIVALVGVVAVVLVLRRRKPAPPPAEWSEGSEPEAPAQP